MSNYKKMNGSYGKTVIILNKNNRYKNKLNKNNKFLNCYSKCNLIDHLKRRLRQRKLLR